MPIAIVVAPGEIIPAVLANDTEADLLATLRGLVFAPALANVQAAREWLLTLEEPSGWFGSGAEVTAYLDRFDRSADLTPQEIATARKALGLSLEALAEAVGIGGNDNTRSKRMWEIENGRAKLNPQATRKLRALLARAVERGE